MSEVDEHRGLMPEEEEERLEASTTNFIDLQLFNQIKDLINQYEYDAELWRLWTISAQGGENILNLIYSSLICSIIWNTSYYYNNLEYPAVDNFTFQSFKQYFKLDQLPADAESVGVGAAKDAIITHFKLIIDGFLPDLKYRLLIIYLEELFNYNLNIQVDPHAPAGVLSGDYQEIENLSYSFNNNNNYKLEVEPFIKNVIKIIIPEQPPGLEDEYLSEIYKVKEEIKAETPKKKRHTLKSIDYDNARQGRATNARERQKENRRNTVDSKRVMSSPALTNLTNMPPEAPKKRAPLKSSRNLANTQHRAMNAMGRQGDARWAEANKARGLVAIRSGSKKRSKKYKKRSKKYKKTRKKRKTKRIQKKTKNKKKKKKTKNKKKRKSKKKKSLFDFSNIF